MPTFRGITIELMLITEKGGFLDEYKPKVADAAANKPANYIESSSLNELSIPTSTLVPIDEDSSIINTLCPILPNSQFFICYSVAEPSTVATCLFFKLYLNGAHVNSWGCGEGQQWSGKAMFGLYSCGEGLDGKRYVEKRMFFFESRDEFEERRNNAPGDSIPSLEVRVYRARGMKRVARQLENFDETPHASGGGEIKLTNAGRATSKHPKKFYTFSLMDPLDKPHATFRFHCRTWDEIENFSSDYFDPVDGESGEAEEEMGEEGEENCPNIHHLSTITEGVEISEAEPVDTGEVRDTGKQFTFAKSLDFGSLESPILSSCSITSTPEDSYLPPTILAPPTGPPPAPSTAESSSSLGYKPHPADVVGDEAEAEKPGRLRNRLSKWFKLGGQY